MLTECGVGRLIYSSAWDYSVRMWQRASPHTCASVLTFSDWVWSVRPKGHTLLVQSSILALSVMAAVVFCWWWWMLQVGIARHLFGCTPEQHCPKLLTELMSELGRFISTILLAAHWPPASGKAIRQGDTEGAPQRAQQLTGRVPQAAAGSQAHVVDISTGAQQRQYTVSEAGVPTSVEGTHDGRLLFATSPHKALLAFDLRYAACGQMRSPIAMLCRRQGRLGHARTEQGCSGSRHSWRRMSQCTRA